MSCHGKGQVTVILTMTQELLARDRATLKLSAVGRQRRVMMQGLPILHQATLAATVAGRRTHMATCATFLRLLPYTTIFGNLWLERHGMRAIWTNYKSLSSGWG